MKKYLLPLIILFVSTLLIQGCGGDEDPEIEDYTTTLYGPGIVDVFAPGPTISIQSGRLNGVLISEIYLNFPQQFGVTDSTKVFFQSVPTTALSIDSDPNPEHSFLLLGNTQLQNGAVTGLNYIFVDQDGDDVLETAYLLQLDGLAVDDNQKTYLVGKATKNDGTAITFVKVKELLDN